MVGNAIRFQVSTSCEMVNLRDVLLKLLIVLGFSLIVNLFDASGKRLGQKLIAF